MKAVVLGCGPAGLFAAHAAWKAGWEVKVFSKKRRSEMYGAQYLHAFIPGLEARPGSVQYLLQGGTAAQYRQKVYGNQEVTVSPEVIPSEAQTVWDIRAAYYDAWSAYEGKIIDRPFLTGMQLQRIEREEKPDLIINSIPRYFLCRNPLHEFKKQVVWAMGDAPERGIFLRGMDNIPEIPDGQVICSADPKVPWYRLSYIFGYRTVEWSYGVYHPKKSAPVKKPISTNCDCFSDLNILHVGRYGTWRKGVLSHEAFFDTWNRIMGDSIAD